MAFFLVSGNSSSREEDQLRDRFQIEAPKAWEKYLARIMKLQGSCSEVTGVDQKILLKRHYEVKQRPGCALFMEKWLMEHGKPIQYQELWAVNSQYEFELVRRKKSKDWVIADWNRMRTEESRTFTAKRLLEISLTPPVTFRVFSKDLSIVVKEPGFTLKRISIQEKKENQLVKVEFSYQPTAKELERLVPSIEGWILYDPDRYWTIDQYKAELTYRGVSEEERNKIVKVTRAGTMEYGLTQDGFPVLKLWCSKVKNPVTNKETRSQMEYKFHEQEPSESDFYLTAFGFPEPKVVIRPKGPPWFLWFIGIALVSLAVGWYLRRRIQKRQMLATQNIPPAAWRK